MQPTKVKLCLHNLGNTSYNMQVTADCCPLTASQPYTAITNKHTDGQIVPNADIPLPQSATLSLQPVTHSTYVTTQFPSQRGKEAELTCCLQCMAG